MSDKKRWMHTRRLNVKDHGPHEPEPYARITDDGSNRCVTCGDYIVELKPIDTRRVPGYPPQSGVAPVVGELEQLYRAAGSSSGDYEVLDRLAVAANLIWICPVRPWNNPKGEPCGDCGITEDQANTLRAVHREDGRTS